MAYVDEIRLHAGATAEAQLAARAWNLGAAPMTMHEELECALAVVRIYILLGRVPSESGCAIGAPLAGVWRVDRVGLTLATYDMARADLVRAGAAGVPRDE